MAEPASGGGRGEELRRRGALSPWGGAPGRSLEGRRQGGLSVGVCVCVVYACVRPVSVLRACVCVCVVGGVCMSLSMSPAPGGTRLGRHFPLISQNTPHSLLRTLTDALQLVSECAQHWVELS